MIRDVVLVRLAPDAEACRAHGLDPGHHRFRRMVVEACADVTRVQFETPRPEKSG
jgi:hypothetical protein